MGAPVIEGRRVTIRGTVQGVGFRPWIYRLATELGVTGAVHNTTAGVTIDACADAATLDEFIRRLHTDLPRAARIDDLEWTAVDAEAGRREAFVIAASDATAVRHPSIPPDLATCSECAAEIRDPGNRRYRYAFTNCTSCGPRFTIAREIPYDRGTTTMAPFVMCPECRREYEAVRDRRFHAQPNACPACGPALTLHGSDGEPIGVADPLAAAVLTLDRGLIVAIKGLGGFHLACDATSADAVARLRARKRRDEKPFAVMVGDMAGAEALAVVGDEQRRLLTGPERPIVLAPFKPGHHLAVNVAPHNRLVGVMLPYTPLHHLLLDGVERPLVMTSGNLSDEPIAYRNEEAIARLGGIADVFLMHDREIETGCDDSVATVIDGRAVVLRRSRGYVPRPIRLGQKVRRPVLACGALLKNTFCLAAGDRAWLGPHVGDLENLEAFDSCTASIARLERFLDIRPEIVACDLHPDYLSTAYARSRPERIKVPVQHHHAHVVSAMAEHRLDGPVIGVAYDGTGYGTDGTMWGGEVLLATAGRFERVGTFRPLALAGGDRAIREPWRLALALLLDACGGDLPPEAHVLLGGVPRQQQSQVRRLLEAPARLSKARGVGRYFDAFGALFLDRPSASFEGQIALEWNQAADPAVRRCYPFDIDSGEFPEADLRQTVLAALQDWRLGEAISAISAAFHNTLAEATVALVKHAVASRGERPIVLTGGCFQNARLAEAVSAALTPELDVYLHHEVPPGDGGIALGQAVAADAIVHGE